MGNKSLLCIKRPIPPAVATTARQAPVIARYKPIFELSSEPVNVSVAFVNQDIVGISWRLGVDIST